MKKSPIKFAAIGECMLELRHLNQHSLAMGFAGDTFNVTLYLARYHRQLNLKVAYVTALGDDSYSNMMLESWQQEGIDTSFVQMLPHKLPGLYLINTDSRGERHFYYYRNQSAAKQLFYSPKIAAIEKALHNYDYLYFSGITLAILDAKSQKQLLTLLKKARQKGAKIIFDTNYRPALWTKKTAAQQAIRHALQVTDIALVTYDDEHKLFGDKTPGKTVQRLRRLNVNEIIVKLGERGCLVADEATEQQLVTPPKVKTIIDTTAAGDSFNAAYLGARIKGLTTIQAAELAHQLASTVIQYPGAIIPKKAMPKLF